MEELDYLLFFHSTERSATQGTSAVLAFIVKACSLLCTRCLRKEDIQLADQYLHLFCQKYEEVNGKDACTPNMHLHLHLKQCLNDYGPTYAFWCYAFERYNGMLGNFPTNQKSIEPQLIEIMLIAPRVT